MFLSAEVVSGKVDALWGCPAIALWLKPRAEKKQSPLRGLNNKRIHESSRRLGWLMLLLKKD
jgi:hypothetical protein